MQIVGRSGEEDRKQVEARKVINKPSQIILFALIIGLIASTSTLVYALTMLWQAQGSVTVKAKETKALGVYWDSGASNPVSSIPFGDLEQGAQVNKILYIKNTGNVAITLDWSSDLKPKSNNYLGDDWLFKNSDGNWQNIRGYSLQPGAVLETQYRLFIATNAPAQTYTWTLQLGY